MRVLRRRVRVMALSKKHEVNRVDVKLEAVGLGSKAGRACLPNERAEHATLRAELRCGVGKSSIPIIKTISFE